MPSFTIRVFQLSIVLFLSCTRVGRGMFTLMVVEKPSFSLIAVLLLWVFARAMGVAASLGHAAVRELDILVTGGLTITIGFYALACRGVALSGLVATAVLWGAFVVAVVRRHDRLGPWSLALTAFTWLAVLYRFFRPV